jgi:MSHA biogenesis protein MshP
MIVKNLQRGFSLISAIFLLVVLSALGAAMVSFSSSQNQSLAMDVMGSRALQAANAGIEWAAYNIISSPGFSGVNTFGPTSGNPLLGTLAPFEVSVTCAATAHSDAVAAGSGVENIWSYEIAASAAFGTAGTPGYVERRVNAKR